MKRLFIGGPADGELIDVEDREFYKVLANSSPESLIKPASEELSFGVTEYRKTSFRGNSHTFYVMAVEGMNPDAVIGSLIEGYLKIDAGKSEELLVDPKKLDAENFLDRMAEAS